MLDCLLRFASLMTEKELSRENLPLLFTGMLRRVSAALFAFATLRVRTVWTGTDRT